MNVIIKKICNKNSVYALIVSFIQTMLSFFSDKLIFSQDARAGLKYLAFKLLFLFVSFLAWYFIIDFFRKLFIEKRRDMKIYLKLFLFFFAIYSVMILLIYPGNWMFDDIGMLSAATSSLGLYALQHILTSVFYILALMVFPAPASVIVVQYAIISVIIAYFIGTLYNKYGRRYLLAGILFILPPVIIHTLYPIRLCMVAFLELLFFFIINDRKEKISGKTIILIVALNTIIAAWRTECIFFVAFVPLYFMLKKYSIKATVAATTTVIAVVVALTAMNNYCQSEEDNIGYKVTGFIRPFHALIIEDYTKNDGHLAEKIADNVDLERLTQYEDGESAFWDFAYEGIKSKSALKKATNLYMELVKKYPKALLKERCDVFSVTQNVLDHSGNIRNIVASGNIYLNNSPISVSNNNELKLTPFNMNLRAKVLVFLYSKGENSVVQKIVRCTYNLILPILLLIFLLIYSIIKKDMVLVISTLFLLAQTFAVFATAPAPLFMYYLPIYICGYGLFFTYVKNFFKK